MSPSFGFVVTVQSTSQLFGHSLAVSKVALFIIYIYELPMSLNIFRVDTRPRFGLLNLAL